MASRLTSRLRSRWPFGSTVERGRWAEARAAGHLRSKGYRIEASNFRCKRGEIDLIAKRGDLLCFVEVKARRRRDYGGALQAVDHRKQQRVAAAAEVYLARNPHSGPCRFDIVTLVREGDGWEIAHLENAYEAGR